MDGGNDGAAVQVQGANQQAMQDDQVTWQLAPTMIGSEDASTAGDKKSQPARAVRPV